MEVVTAEEARDAAIRKLLKTEVPYSLHRDLRDDAPGEYVIVYRPTVETKPAVTVDGIMKKSNGRYLLDLVLKAWANGVIFGRIKTEG